MLTSHRINLNWRASVLAAGLALSLFGTSACTDRTAAANEAGNEASYYLQQGDFPAARKAVNEALSHRDDLVDLHLLRGRIENAAGERAGAYDAYFNAMSLDPTNIEALSGVSQLGLALGNLDQSLDATERLLTLDPNRSGALLVRGLHELVRRRYNSAIRYADRVIELTPSDENAYILKARALFLKEETREALAVLENAQTLDQTTAPLALTRLEIYRELGNAEGMEQQFALLRSARPDDVELRIDEANMWFKRGDQAKAFGQILAAIEQAEPGSDADNLVAAQTVRLVDEYGFDGISPVQLVRMKQLASPTVARALARHMIVAGEYDRALELAELTPGPVESALDAQIKARRGQAKAALTDADKILRQDATNCDALVARSLAQRAQGNLDGAVQSGQQASTECPDMVSAYVAAAEAYDAWDRDAAVRRIYGQGVTANPQNLMLFRKYAEWLEANGQERRAVAVLRRYTRDSPASLAGLELYREACVRAGSACAGEAAAEKAKAATRYGLDLEPGRLQPNALFGRFVKR